MTRLRGAAPSCGRTRAARGRRQGGAADAGPASRAPREGGEVAAERAVRQGGPAGFWPKPR